MSPRSKRWRVAVVRLRRTEDAVDQYNEPIPGELARHKLPDAFFDPSGSDITPAAGEASTSTDPTVYWRNEFPDVRSGDQIEVDGDVWRVDGRPEQWPKGLVVRLTGTHTTRGTP